LYLIIIFLPLIISFVVLLFGRIIGRSGATIIIVIGMLLSLMSSFLLFIEIIFSGTSTKIILFE